MQFNTIATNSSIPRGKGGGNVLHEIDFTRNLDPSIVVLPCGLIVTGDSFLGLIITYMTSPRDVGYHLF